MHTNWKELAIKLGSLRNDGSESGGTHFAESAFDEIFGDQWIQETVEHIISFKPGRELAMNCLRHFHSKKATLYAYSIYNSSTGERADQAVWLIKSLANPIAAEWVEEFLNDQNVIERGLAVLDQLLWSEQIPFDSKAESLLELASKNSNGILNDHVQFVKKYINERNSR